MEPQGPRPRTGPVSSLWIWLVLGAVVLFLLLQSPDWMSRNDVDYSFFLAEVQRGNVQEVMFQGASVRGKFKEPPQAPGGTADKKLAKDFRTVVPPVEGERLMEILEKHDVRVAAKEDKASTGLALILTFLPWVLLLAFVLWMSRRIRDQFNGGLLGTFGKSPAKRYEKSKLRVAFEDVANLETAKQELQEIVEFLKNPEKFQRLGGQIPKGVLLMGPPGTGKTLLARAVAGEAGVPFYSISGSEFIQMFVGVGAGRVRDMFKTAKENSPCILFIDEIDAVGRVRGAGLGGGHDEREQTLNQILSEMDGFSPNESVIVLAATNRPDVLDPALLRPGRFDRHVTVDRPTREGRLGILKVHTRNVPLAGDVDLEQLAASTVGLTGADLRNLVNEAALLATREGKEHVEMSDFEQAKDKVLMGPKRDEILTEREKRMVAYHEGGHALLAWLVPGADPLVKVSIIPRGRSLGATQQLPGEDRHNYSQSYLTSRLTIMLGGRAAEKLVFDEVSSGAESDLKEATRLARSMVTQWGMSERLGPVAFRAGEEHIFLGKEIQETRDFSEHTARIIDEEVRRILNEAGEQAATLLEQHRDRLSALAEALIKREVLGQAEIEEVLSRGERAVVRASAEA